jgi:F-type H+-transporting ATPase subunit gamma
MAKAKDIQKRIRSIGSTKKITRAMEMVSATKMRRAVEAVLKTRSYANLSWATVLNLSQAINNSTGNLHPLFQKRQQVKKVAIVLITSNRGLCAGYNTAIIKKAHESIKKHHLKDGNLETDVDFILIGKKGQAVYRYYGYKIVAEFTKQDIITSAREAVPVGGMIIKDFLSGKYDKVMVAYTDFISAVKQVPRIKQILPIDIGTRDEYLGIVGEDSRLKIDQKFIKDKEEKYLKTEKFNFEYLFEPNAEEVLDDMLPRLIEIQLYQALLEANASEHSARMSAMNQATNAAGDLVDELTLSYNKARQATITSELAEISAGANALSE